MTRLFISKWTVISLVLAMILSSCGKTGIKNNWQEVKFSQVDSLRRVDVYIGPTLFTSYWYADTLPKPFLYPVNSASGTTVTRGFPLFPRAGERVDHPHQTGLWFNYGNVNGLDFWNNSYAVPADQKFKYGKIVHQKFDTLYVTDRAGVMTVSDQWEKMDGTTVLNERFTYIFSGNDSLRIITRITQLTAADTQVILKDNKEGLWGMRMDRCLEMPSQEPLVFTDANGNPTGVPVMNNEGVSGMYYGSNGLQGDSVWGTRNNWVMLTGEKEGEPISVVIFDHPGNPGFPAHFHARGYGLFAVNNLGQHVFNPSESEQDFTLQPGQSLNFTHRLIICSGVKLTSGEAESLYKEFIEEKE